MRRVVIGGKPYRYLLPVQGLGRLIFVTWLMKVTRWLSYALPPRKRLALLKWTEGIVSRVSPSVRG
jgi:hypothetical protein